MVQAADPEITLLNIELNSSCNLRCRWCALDHGKPRIRMQEETLELVFRQLAENRLPHLRRIDLHNGGETLLHADLPAMFGVMRRYKERIAAGPVIGLLTNAMALTEKKALQILHSGVVDQMRFSLDGGSAEEFERIRRGAKWDVVRNNVMRFLLLNHRLGKPVSTEAICMIEDRGPDVQPFSHAFSELLGLIDKVVLRHPHNWDGSADLGVDDASYRSIAAERVGEPCFLLRRNLVVLPDGSVTVCCNDLNGRGVMGSVHAQGLDDFVRHPARMRMIDLFRAGRKEHIALCAHCTGFYAPPTARDSHDS